MTVKPDWGVLPTEAIARLRRLEWDDTAHLKARLLNQRAFPIRLSLKAPTASQALADLTTFRHWVAEWSAFAQADRIEWQMRRYRQLGEQRIPRALLIDSISELASILGQTAEARAARWEILLSPLLQLIDQHIDLARYQTLYCVLISRLDSLERLNDDEPALLARLLPQLQARMGEGGYLRALPLIGVDTKFMEVQQRLVTDLLDVLHDGAVSEAGGLHAWLDCTDGPRGWLVVKPLCQRTMSSLGGHPLLQLPTRQLVNEPLPCQRVLVVENLQSGLALPELPDTVAVIGGGRNVAWMAASWLKQCQVGYWGDIDTWGLQILADARQHCPHLRPLMMDIQTVAEHQARMVDEPEPCSQVAANLNAEERQLVSMLQAGKPGQTRLEQERLSADWILAALREWVES